MQGRAFALAFLLACGGPASGLRVQVEADSPATRGETLREAVSIETGAGEVTPILPAGCTLPCEERVTFGTAEDDQGEILIYVYRGNGSTTASSHALGVYEIAGLPPEPAGSRDVAVTFRAAGDGISLAAEAIPGVPLALRPARE